MAEIETAGDWHWRNSMKPVRFFNFDARVTIVFFLLILPTGPLRGWLLLFSIFIVMLFWLLERRGLTVPSALRAFRSWVLGKNRSGYIWYRRRKPIDYGQ